MVRRGRVAHVGSYGEVSLLVLKHFDALVLIPLITLDYSVAAIGSGIMIVALIVLAEFVLPEK